MCVSGRTYYNFQTYLFTKEVVLSVNNIKRLTWLVLSFALCLITYLSNDLLLLGVYLEFMEFRAQGFHRGAMITRKCA